MASPRTAARLASPRAAAMAICAASLLLSGGCASTNVLPLTDPGSRFGVSRDERRLIQESEDHEAELQRRGFVIEDPDLQQYLDGVVSLLVPPGLPSEVGFHVRVIRAPTINAYALANGGIHLHAGLVVRLENEAQLAHVLGHEMAHTVQRHQLRGLRDYENKTVAAKVVQMTVGAAAAVAAGGDAMDLTTLLVGLGHAAAVSGYGRELEQQADLEGLTVMAEAGYAATEAPRLFALLNEVDEPGAVTSFFYGSHPSNDARAAYTRELLDSESVASDPSGRVDAESYQQAMRGVCVENIRLRLRARHYRFALDEAEAALRRYGDDAQLHYYRGEAHRRAANDPEGAAREEAARRREALDDERLRTFRDRVPQALEAAESAFRRALVLDPTLVLAHRGLGLVAHQRGDGPATREHLELYLERSTRVLDRRFVERILEEAGP